MKTADNSKVTPLSWPNLIYIFLTSVEISGHRMIEISQGISHGLVVSAKGTSQTKCYLDAVMLPISHSITAERHKALSVRVLLSCCGPLMLDTHENEEQG